MPCAKENCGNIKSLISGVVFFVVVVASFVVVVAFSSSRASVLYKLHFTFWEHRRRGEQSWRLLSGRTTSCGKTQRGQEAPAHGRAGTVEVHTPNGGDLCLQLYRRCRDAAGSTAHSESAAATTQLQFISAASAAFKDK